MDFCDGLIYLVIGFLFSLSIDENIGLIIGILDVGFGFGVVGVFIEDGGVLIIEVEMDFVNILGGWEFFVDLGVDFLLVIGNNFGNVIGGEVLIYDIEINILGVYCFYMKSDIIGIVGLEENDSWFKIDNIMDVYFFCL